VKKLLAKAHKVIPYFLLFLVIGLIASSVYLFYEGRRLQNEINKANQRLGKLINKQDELNQKLPEQLFKDHLNKMENIALNEENRVIKEELEALKGDPENSENQTIDEVYELYQNYEEKLSRNNNLELKIENETNLKDIWGNLLLKKDFDKLKASINEEISSLDNKYDEYLASLPPPSNVSGDGYSYTTVNTEKGEFGVYLMKFPKSEVTVKTIAAIDDDCDNNCATKSLEQYVNENDAYGGMAGSYACPADYDSCSGKVWSFNFALYDSNDKKWLNDNALTWSETGMITFTGQSSDFYKKTSDYDGDYVTAGVSNFPSLLKDGRVVVDSGDIDSYQEVKGLRGAIGVDDDDVYLAYITGASVIDAAYAMKAVGAEHALNLDGGGTAAMFINGGYVVGPGRPLANAVLILK